MIIAKKNETKEMFEKNFQLLTPWLKDTVLSIDDEEMNKKIEIIYNDNGYPICRYRKEDKVFNITSERPVEEAKMWYDKIAEQGTGTIFLFGSGFGYPLFEIFERKMPHTLVVLFERDLYMFKAMLFYFDFAPIIETNKITFLVGDSEYFANAFEQLFFSVFFVSCTYPTLAFSYSAIRNFKNEYIDIYKYVFSQLSLMVFYIGNDHQDNLIGFCNLLSNVNEIIKNPCISCLKDKYKDVPAFIISNGPSLDKNIQKLSEIQNRGLIISVESAIIPLLKKNIKPDVLAVIERTKNTYNYHFKNIDYPDDIALLGLALVDERVFPSFPGAKIPIFREREVLNNWLNKHLGDGSGIDAGANVSHLALELAVYFGANPIIFVGQDFAYGSDGVTHSAESIYNDENGKKLRETIQSRPVVYVEGNDGSKLPSNQLWVDFKMGLERKISVHSDKLFLNATEGGAKIAGTQCDELDNIIRRYCDKPLPCRVNEIISENKMNLSASKRKKKLTEFIDSVEKYGPLFRNLASETLKGKIECKKMLSLSLSDDFYKFWDILEGAYLKNLEIFNKFIFNGLFRCFSQQAIFADYYMINRLGTIDTQEKISEVFRVQYNLFCHLNIISQSVSIHFENASEELRGLLSELEEEEHGYENNC